jgi:hypothetical protein
VKIVALHTFATDEKHPQRFLQVLHLHHKQVDITTTRNPQTPRKEESFFL